MKKLLLIVVCVLFGRIGPNVVGQEFPESPKASERHQWLQKFVGEWTVKNTGKVAEDQPPVEGKGVMNSQMIGPFWVINQMKVKVADFEVTGIQTIGYDAKKQKYIGTWIDSSNDFMWKYEGDVDASGKKIVLEATGPDMTKPGKMAKYRDAYEFQGDNRIVITSSVQNDDGQWITFMNGTAVRNKKED